MPKWPRDNDGGIIDPPVLQDYEQRIAAASAAADQRLLNALQNQYHRERENIVNEIESSDDDDTPPSPELARVTADDREAADAAEPDRDSDDNGRDNPPNPSERESVTEPSPGAQEPSAPTSPAPGGGEPTSGAGVAEPTGATGVGTTTTSSGGSTE